MSVPVSMPVPVPVLYLEEGEIYSNGQRVLCDVEIRGITWNEACCRVLFPFPLFVFLFGASSRFPLSMILAWPEYGDSRGKRREERMARRARVMRNVLFDLFFCCVSSDLGPSFPFHKQLFLIQCRSRDWGLMEG